MSTLQTLDAAGRPRSPATMPGYFAGHPPRNKGHRYPADRRGWRRSSRSCARPAPGSTAHGFAA
jgi:hypothetical protein